ncbi:hypothetical protein BDP27DRAFT_1435148 [Rhodocollybia butyracea]|uniref:Uncharacterized protein n=1 Tax=Rhodocollybia butyracea TaxID=206335 RepID=A0A9P5P7X6_9AGAR|nr:hypothetical protein BDP27DRAFT_1435148 [Rhodocollybia butyracea]
MLFKKLCILTAACALLPYAAGLTLTVPRDVRVYGPFVVKWTASPGDQPFTLQVRHVNNDIPPLDLGGPFDPFESEKSPKLNIRKRLPPRHHGYYMVAVTDNGWIIGDGWVEATSNEFRIF